MAYKISTSCIACGSCICECPVEAISAGDIYVINPEKCIDCGACVAGCPTDAIETQNQMETSNSKLGGLELNESSCSKEKTQHSSISKFLKVLAYIDLFGGLLLSLLLLSLWVGGIYDGDFYAGLFFACIISSLFSFGLLLGFAKIVEAADKYLKQ